MSSISDSSPPELTSAQRERFSRHLTCPQMGEAGQRRLRDAHVAVIGAGGLGAPVISYLAGAGLGALTIVDPDTVDVSNLARQLLFRDDDIGQPKAVVAQSFAKRLNPDGEISAHTVTLSQTNATQLLADCDLVIDATDNFPTRHLIDWAAAELNIPNVWGAVIGWHGQVTIFWQQPGGQGRAEAGVRLTDVFPNPDPQVHNCSTGGVVSPVCGVVGSVMATEAIKLLVGAGESLIGRLLLIDALTCHFRTVPIRHNDAAPPATPLFTPPLEITCDQLRQELGEAHDSPVIWDVREPDEIDCGTVPTARPHPLATVAVCALPPTSRVVLVCRSGVRAAQAAQILRSRGVLEPVVLRGGWLAWSRSSA